MGIWRVLLDPQSFFVIQKDQGWKNPVLDHLDMSLLHHHLQNEPSSSKSGICLSIELIEKQWEVVVVPIFCTASLALSTCS